LLVLLRVTPVGLDECHLVSVPVYHCVTRWRQDIDSILHLTPAAIGQCFSASDVRRANTTYVSRIAAFAVWSINVLLGVQSGRG